MEVYSNIEVGKRIREKRNKFKYTIYELAELADISPRFLSAIERGEKGMSYITLKKMCDIFCVSSDYLLFGKNNNFNINDNANIVELISNIDNTYIPLLEKSILNFTEIVNAVTKNITNKNT